MQSHLDEYIEKHLHPLASAAISMLPGKRTEENTKAVTSSGSSVVIIPREPELSYVLQVYRSHDTYQKIKAFCEKVAKHSELIGQRPNLAACSEFIDEHNCIKFQKIVPLNHRIHDGIPIDKELIDIERLKADIYEAILFLNDAGVSHGDTSLDNIGLLDGKYVLFDYDKCGDRNYMKDVQIFERSLALNGFLPQ